MTSRVHDPRRLDVVAAAATGASLAGRWPLSELSRLADDAAAPVDAPAEWSARFEQRRAQGGMPQIWLHLRASARVARECQRCLQPVLLPLDVERAFRFVATEEEAAALDAESEDDILALPNRLDLRDLVEDELLLSLPIVPMHEQCPLPLASAAADGIAKEAAPANPFAALAALKRGSGR